MVGSISGLSGNATFPEASQAANAVFDEVNAAGGIQGRDIKYKITDDKGDPATASANARQIVGNDGAVALVGSASLLECQVNARGTDLGPSHHHRHSGPRRLQPWDRFSAFRRQQQRGGLDLAKPPG